MANSALQAAQVLVIELHIPAVHQILVQSILQGEDGLGVIRSFDHALGRQQLWTTPSQRHLAIEWLDSLPEDLGCRVTGEWIWHERP